LQDELEDLSEQANDIQEVMGKENKDTDIHIPL
jgi:hypothetical protein